MPRLIEKNDLLAKAIKLAITDTFMGVKSIIDSIPTVDAVPVVRCKDCIHCINFHEYICTGVQLKETYQCLKMLERYNEDSYSNFDNEVDSDFYCSYGERKEDSK